MAKSKVKNHILFLFLLVLLIITILASTAFGSVRISWQEIIDILFKGEQGGNYQILINIRLPRVAFALVSGMCLAISGLLLQVVLKNPMADSGFLGISSGASLATTAVLLVISVSSVWIPIISFVGGMLAFIIILVVAWEKEISPTRLILTGAALNAILRGVQSFLMTMHSDKLHGVISWQNGNLAGKTWEQFLMFCVYILPALILIILLIPKLNVLNLSDQTIYSLGVPVRKYRIIISTLGVYMAAITVSQVGMIGFVGLIVPHIAKVLVGGNSKVNLPFTMLIGALLLTIADLFSRVVASPLEIPIGTVMSVIGGPFFLYLVARKKRGEK
ncbi:FecCD family ABC transporter permease [Fastidiosipila sanguinis]|uniref:Iron ABC transporter permease n=1 Tax=Fastidiosipila sanguinis TaxID=236753 RepID=A0A2S0KPZ0_9FIRM|nr:iron ABC transporter permease [Fastidiosipila sanguinis]AVM43093.1 iron ABC transporter permease [Fastidiosipila sanguinis]